MFPINFLFSQYESGRLYIRISDETLKPTRNADSVFVFGDPILQQIIDSNNVIKITRPFSKNNPNNTEVEKKLFNTYHIYCDCNEDLLRESLQDAFQTNVYIEKFPKIHTFGLPDDYDLINSFSDNCNNMFSNYYLDNINAIEAWDVTKGDAEIKIGIVDTRANLDHEDYINGDGSKQYDVVKNFLPELDYHGAGVAGVAAAATDNGKGISSIGYNVKMNIYQARGVDFYNALYEMISDDDVNILNMSWGVFAYNETLHNIIKLGYERGMVLVAAAGNGNENPAVQQGSNRPNNTPYEETGEGRFSYTAYWYPASFDEVLAISANGPEDNFIQPFNNVDCVPLDLVYQHHDKIDLVAPGFKIGTLNLSEENTDKYQLTRGTSFSSPIVSGVVGLMLSVSPDIDQSTIKKILRYTSDNIYPNNLPRYYQDGLVSAHNYNSKTLNYESADSWLVSPKLDFSKLGDASIEFNYSYTDPESLTSLQVYISKDFDETCNSDIIPEQWEKIFDSKTSLSLSDIENPNADFLSWKPRNSVYISMNDFPYLSVYKDEIVNIAFRFIGEEGKAITHVIDNIVVSDGGWGEGVLKNEEGIIKCDYSDVQENQICLCEDFNAPSLTAKYDWKILSVDDKGLDWNHNITKQFGAGKVNAGKAVKMAKRYNGLKVELVSKEDACSFDEGAAEILLTHQNPSLESSFTLNWFNKTTGQYFGTGLKKDGLTKGDYEVTITNADNESLIPLNFYINGIDECIIDYPDGLIISNSNVELNDLNGDGRIIVRGPIIVEENINYSINNKTIEFVKDPLNEQITNPNLPSSGIVVKEGATLSVRNSVLKGLNDCNSMWEGITVWGDEPVEINPNFGGWPFFNPIRFTIPPKNGKLDIANSTIRDATVGVALYRTPTLFTSNRKEYGRGEVQARNVNFINNLYSVRFNALSSVENNSKIENCSFLQNGLLLNEKIYKDGEMYAFISLRNVTGVEIKANKFTGYTGFNADKRGIGIISYDASYIVERGLGGSFWGGTAPNSFKDLSKGIDVYATGGANSVRIKSNEFKNVYQGITFNGSNFDEISFNEFDIPLGEEDFNSWGIFAQTSSGFLATENMFKADESNEYTFGVVAKDISSVNGSIYRNTFEGTFSVATQTEGTTNNRLTIDCNKYNSINTYDWAVLADDMADQGLCDIEDASLASINIFSDCPTSNQSQIYSLANFDYSSVPGFAPDCVSSNISIVDCDIQTTSYDELCPQIVETLCPNCITELTDLLPILTGFFREQIKAELYRRLAQMGEINDLIAVISDENSEVDRRILIPTYLNQGKVQEAKSELNQLLVTTDVDEDFKRLFSILIAIAEDNRKLVERTPTEEEAIRSLSEVNNETAVFAESVLAIIESSNYIRFPKQLPLGGKSWENNQEEKSKEEKELVKVYPNPSNSDVTVEFEKVKKAKAMLYDNMGRLVRTFHTNDNQTKYRIEGLSHGIYNLRLIDTNGDIESKRIIIR